MQMHTTATDRCRSTWPPPTLGLSKDHKPPRLSLTVARGGTLVEVRSSGWQTRVAPSVVRGDVTAFSPRSRRRCLRMMACIDRRDQTKPPLFLTLTYPATWPGEPAVLKRDLQVFWQRLKRRFPWLAAIWRVELQKRGAPHYHLLLFGVSFLSASWVAKQWYDVVASGDPGHLAAGSQVAACRSWAMAASYAAKYLAKLPEDADPVKIGRHWGVLGRANLPTALATYPLDWLCFFTLKAMIESRLWPTGDGPPERGDFCGCWIAWPGWESAGLGVH